MLTHLGATLITILSWFSVYRAVVSADGDSIFVVSINVSWSLYYSALSVYVHHDGSPSVLRGNH
ncbi:hypothetical protein pipiens_000595, partial [Culex pipiens pipiens]